MGVDQQLLARLAILHDDHAEVRELHLERVVEPNSEDFMTLRQAAELVGEGI